MGAPWRGSSLWHRYTLQSQGVSGSRGIRWQSHIVRSTVVFQLHYSLPFHSRFHRATAPSLIKHFRDCVKGAPRELYANVLLTAGPEGQDSLVVIQMCYVGPKVKGQEFLQAISSWDGERCLLNEVDEKSFLHQQDSVAQVLRGNGMLPTLTLCAHGH